MQINGFNTMNHFFYKDDCLSFLRENHDLFDLIFCDPPTFSNSKERPRIPHKIMHEAPGRQRNADLLDELHPLQDVR